MQGHPIFLTMYEGEAEFDMRILTDRCMVEAFVMGGRHAMTSMGPQDVAERSKGATPGVAGGSILESVHID
jgi:hypothetical protein